MIKARILIFIFVFSALFIPLSFAQESRTQSLEELMEEIRKYEEECLKEEQRES